MGEDGLRLQPIRRQPVARHPARRSTGKICRSGPFQQVSIKPNQAKNQTKSD